MRAQVGYVCICVFCGVRASFIVADASAAPVLAAVVQSHLRSNRVYITTNNGTIRNSARLMRR